jgi:hypothetical protein
MSDLSTTLLTTSIQLLHVECLINCTDSNWMIPLMSQQQINIGLGEFFHFPLHGLEFGQLVISAV